jgi:SAM-dependent methyltransferase
MLGRLSLESISPVQRAKARDLLNKVGYDTTDWVRVAMYRSCFAYLRSLGPEALDVLEISGGPQWVREFRFKSYMKTEYPGFDICHERIDRSFDVVIADQVFEHLERPLDAAKNVFSMLLPGGHFVIATPFLLRVHGSPHDYSRWTEDGLAALLVEAGFPRHAIKTQSWGNRACVKANLNHWRKYGWFRPMQNEPNFPVMVWAFATRPEA